MNNRRVITTDAAEEDIRIEGSLRPQTLAEYIGQEKAKSNLKIYIDCLLYTSPSPRDQKKSRMPSSA
jgi:Holliday junction resolvasome RuvABC ATP-dependent DNA helicase subunit